MTSHKGLLIYVLPFEQTGADVSEVTHSGLYAWSAHKILVWGSANVHGQAAG